MTITESAQPAPSRTTLYALRYMRLDDVPQVVALDKLSFPTPWNASSYEFEIAQSQTSHMVILTMPRAVPTGWRGWWSHIRGQPIESIAVGYAGMWIIAGEAHVSTIAVHPSRRGQHLGEVILNGLMQRALALNAEYAILEVRVGNEPAQALYRKYGYEVIDTRPNYYRDNNEDAYIMQVPALDSPYVDRLRLLTEALKKQVTWVDRLTTTDRRHPSPSIDPARSGNSASTSYKV